MSVALFATRVAPDGQTPVVLKVLRPQILRVDKAAALAVQKEAVALGRLNERTPPTQFVVRLVDVGTTRVDFGSDKIEVPWLAIEYVYGGADGTTLEERMGRQVERSNHAFEPERAVRAVECLTQGLTAIHEVGVIHRDITPANVLCCGHGDDEIFKIADFGIARPRGMTATFGPMLMGTAGHAAPEQLLMMNVGPATDVFSLATVIYFILTGEDYFLFDHPGDFVALAKKPGRRRLEEAAWLHPELRSRPAACAAIDAALAQATTFTPGDRPQNAGVLAQMIVPSLRQTLAIGRATSRAVRPLQYTLAPEERQGWTTRQNPDDDRFIRAVAWDGDGRCLAVTPHGLTFWDGIHFRNVPMGGLEESGGIHFVLRSDAGAWLVGGDNATVALCSSEGISKCLVGPDPSARFVLASGDVRDLAVLVGTRGDEPPLLYGLAAGRWIKPAVLSRAASVTSLSRLDDCRWLVTGRAQAGEGFAVIYEPLNWEVHRVKVPACRAFLASSTRSDLSLGVVVGASGRAVRFEADQSVASVVQGEPDLSAVFVDEARRIWAGSAGALWLQRPGEPSAWELVHRTDWVAPFISLFVDSGRVMAMTANGGILEGRLAAAR